MAYVFPSQEWLDRVVQHLNEDEKYEKVAAKWEGDIIVDVQPSGALTEQTKIYLDLWHGKCRSGRFLGLEEDQGAAFVLKATYENAIRVLSGELDPMQAMLTRKLSVQGSMAYMMRNVPTVIDFVRSVSEVTDEFLS